MDESRETPNRIWRSAYPIRVTRVQLATEPLKLVLELESPSGDNRFGLSLGQPAELNQIHELVYAEELRIVDRRQEEAPGLEFARYRVEAWDEDNLRVTFLCDEFSVSESERQEDRPLEERRQLTLRQAYLATFEFLRMRNERASSDELIGMLSSMQLLPDGDSADPAASLEFVEAMGRVLREEASDGYTEANLVLRPEDTA